MGTHILLFLIIQAFWYAWMDHLIRKYRRPTHLQLPPCSDIIHDLFPVHPALASWIHHVPDAIIYFMAVFSVYCGWNQDQTLVEPYLWNWLIMQYMRMVVSAATLFPTPVNRQRRPITSPHTFDIMFSGHTTGYWLFYKYTTIWAPELALPVALPMVLLGMFASVYCREHYTADVLVSCCLSYWGFCL